MMYNSTKKNAGLLGLCLLIPLFFPLSSEVIFPFWYEKSFFVSCLTLFSGSVIAFIAVWKDYIQPSKITTIDYLVFSLILYLLYNIYSSAGTINSVGVQVLWLGSIYYLFRLYSQHWQQSSYSLWVYILLAAGLLQCFYALGQSAGKFELRSIHKYTGSFMNPGPLAGFLGILVPLAINALMNASFFNPSKNPILKTIPILYLIFGVITILFSGSRAGLLGALIGSLILLLPYLKSKFQWKMNLRFIYVIGILLLIGFIGILYFLKQDSADGRLLIWKISAPMFLDQPWMGQGWGQFLNNVGGYQMAYLENGLGSMSDKYILLSGISHVFNETLRWIIETGLVGVLFILILVFFLLKKMSFRLGTIFSSVLLKGTFTSLIVLWVFAQFSYPSDVLYLAMLTPMLLGLFVSLLQGPKVYIEKKGIALFYAGFVMVVLGGILFWSQSQYQEARQWEQAHYYYKNKDYSKAIQLYEVLEPKMKGEVLFNLQYGKALSLADRWVESNAIYHGMEGNFISLMYLNTLGYNYFHLKQYEQAIQYLDQSIRLSPFSLYPQYLLALAYEGLNEIDKAVYRAKIMLSIDPKVNNTMTTDIRAVMQSLVDDYSPK